jgi:hypothetical protein
MAGNHPVLVHFVEVNELVASGSPVQKKLVLEQ